MSQIEESKDSGDIKFDSETLESYWVIYSNNFNLRFRNKGLLSKFKKFINEEPNKDNVLKRLSTAVLDFDENISMNRIYKLLQYVHNDYFINFTKFVSSVEDYRKIHTDKDDETLYNKLIMLRSLQDAENFYKIFRNYYDYYIRAISSVYEIVHNKSPENVDTVLESFDELYVKIDINIRLYHYDFFLEIFNMLNRSTIKIIKAIYSDQSGCCVATPAFNVLDIMIKTLRNLIQILKEI
jgi:hypothetical protein